MRSAISSRSPVVSCWPPFIQKLIDSGKLKGIREGKLKGIREGKLKGIREGKLKGIREGKLKGIREGKKDTLLRLLARAGLMLTESERVQACTDIATLDLWIDNVLGAKTATDVLS
ncbi:hypothetical protein [Sorangium sp. So ce1000]|uniref:hypothetical protein n=1 Tax=Sorangium sp. So ce1000 TaxID=3133325 RepID=UPI003F63E729